MLHSKFNTGGLYYSIGTVSKVQFLSFQTPNQVDYMLDRESHNIPKKNCSGIEMLKWFLNFHEIYLVEKNSKKNRGFNPKKGINSNLNSLANNGLKPDWVLDSDPRLKKRGNSAVTTQKNFSARAISKD